MMNLIRLENINKHFGTGEAKTQALNNINLVIEKGEMIAITGPSGSGKSTLLNILGCLDKPNEGKYYLEGQDTESYNNKELARLRGNYFGFIVQNFALIDDYTVYKNVKVPLDYTSLSRSEKKNRILNILQQLDILNKKDNYPKELSGGQNQRTAIARALINNPHVILADEPTGALDKKMGAEVLQLLENINKKGYTIIMVTHDDNLAKSCDRIIRIEDGCVVNK